MAEKPGAFETPSRFISPSVARPAKRITCRAAKTRRTIFATSAVGVSGSVANSIPEIAAVIGAQPNPGQRTARAILAAEVVIGIPPYCNLPSCNDERGHPRLDKKNAAKEMRDLGLKVTTASRGRLGWVQAFRLRRGKTRGATCCRGWLTKSDKLAGRNALERRRPGSGQVPKPLIWRDGGVSGLCPATGRVTRGRPAKVIARQRSTYATQTSHP